MSDATLEDVFVYWAAYRREDPEAVMAISDAFACDPGEPCCFACGWRVPDFMQPSIRENWALAVGYLERGHLVNKTAGGAFEPANLVPLCRTCNAKMGEWEFTSRAAALAWVVNHPRRSWIFQIISDNAAELHVESLADAQAWAPPADQQRMRELMAEVVEADTDTDRTAEILAEVKQLTASVESPVDVFDPAFRKSAFKGVGREFGHEVRKRFRGLNLIWGIPMYEEADRDHA